MTHRDKFRAKLLALLSFCRDTNSNMVMPRELQLLWDLTAPAVKETMKRLKHVYSASEFDRKQHVHVIDLQKITELIEQDMPAGASAFWAGLTPAQRHMREKALERRALKAAPPSRKDKTDTQEKMLSVDEADRRIREMDRKKIMNSLGRDK